jgi:hypothetical protein
MLIRVFLRDQYLHDPKTQILASRKTVEAQMSAGLFVAAALAAVVVGAWLVLIWFENNTPKGG